jgi:cobalt/nickel transport system permease protein
MHTAQELRLGYSGLKKRLRSTSLLIATLFIRTLEQGERTFTAMSARGYDGNIRVIEELPRPKKATLLGVILFDVALVLVLLFTLNVGVV